MTLQATDKHELMFRAFSDRTRLRILHLLNRRAEICVCDLMRVLDLPQAKVSRHLAYLRKAGLVGGKKKNRWMYYRLLPAKTRFHTHMLQCLDCCSKDLSALSRDIRQLDRCCEGSACCD